MGIALVLVAGIGIATPMAAGAKVGADVWEPSTWTGEVAGPPVPGTGLPAAPAPTVPVQLPEGYDVSPTYEGQAQCDPARYAFVVRVGRKEKRPGGTGFQVGTGRGGITSQWHPLGLLHQR